MNRLLAGLLTLTLPSMALADPLKIGYSDWPGWIAWEIAEQKGWFEEAEVDVELVWMDYGASMEAFGAGQLDAVTMTNGDALVTGATAQPSVLVVLTDYSNGNDMLVGAPGIESVTDLKGKNVGLERGFVPHLLTLKALEANDMTEEDITIVDTPTNETPQILRSGDVSAICAWQPNSGAAIKEVPGAQPIFTSADAKGLIYDGLFVTPASLEAEREEWVKVVKVWDRIANYLADEDNLEEALGILAGRVNVDPREYEAFLDGTYILTLEEATSHWEKGEGLESVYGSSQISDDFNVSNGVYESSQEVDNYLDPSLTKEALEASASN